jgi:hypothetical protein
LSRHAITYSDVATPEEKKQFMLNNLFAMRFTSSIIPVVHEMIIENIKIIDGDDSPYLKDITGMNDAQRMKAYINSCKLINKYVDSEFEFSG